MVFARISLEWNKGVSCLSIYAFIASFLVKEVIKYIFIESSHFYDEWLQEKQNHVYTLFVQKNVYTL